MPSTKEIAKAWCLKCFKEMKASKEELKLEAAKLNDEDYLDIWSKVLNFKPLEIKTGRVEFDELDNTSYVIVNEYEIGLRAKTFDRENDGIGAYECHGYRGYDRGSDSGIVTSYEIVDPGELSSEQHDYYEWYISQAVEGLVRYVPSERELHCPY